MTAWGPTGSGFGPPPCGRSSARVPTATLISKAAYGHTGFTGTQVWIDPTNNLFLVFLTNRAFDPKARDSLKGLKAIRTSLSDAAIRLVPHACGQELISNC